MKKNPMDIWGADRVPLFSNVQLTGTVTFADPEFPNAHAACYIEVDDEERNCRWPVFCDLRQLGLHASTRQAILRRPRSSRGRGGAGRMLLTRTMLHKARSAGREPTIDFVELVQLPRIFSPGLPCSVVTGPLKSPLAGHQCLVVDKNYRHVDDGRHDAIKSMIKGILDG